MCGEQVQAARQRASSDAASLASSPADYEAIIDDVIGRIGADDSGTLVKLLELPDLARGYEDVKLRNIERLHAQREDLLLQLGQKNLQPRNR